MRNMLAVVLLVVLASNLAGIFVFFEFQKWDIRREIKAAIKQNLPDSELSIITVTSENAGSLEWNDETEFEYNGQWYDVVRKEIAGANHITYYCISDTKETDLFTNLADLIKKMVNSRKNCKTPVNHLFSVFAQICLSSVETSFQPFLRSASVQRAAHSPYESPYLLISSPPPKFA